MSVTSLDFESSAYTNFATPALGSGHNRGQVYEASTRVRVQGAHLSFVICRLSFFISLGSAELWSIVLLGVSHSHRSFSPVRKNCVNSSEQF